MSYRERRSWTEQEDQLLRDAVGLEHPSSINPSRWGAISKHVPNRTNKDCRKRWFSKMASDVVKGGWSSEEDANLVKGIEKYGTKWPLVSAYVQSRNSDQCAKRWTETLNPMIDRTRWSAEADALLLSAVEEHGKLWTKIARIYFPGRTGLSAKNRYNSISRPNTEALRRSHKPWSQSEDSSATISSSLSTSSMSLRCSSTQHSTSPTLLRIVELPRHTPLESLPPAESSSEDTSLVSLLSTPTYEELCGVMLSTTGDISGDEDIFDSRQSHPSTVLSSSSSLFPWGSMDEAYLQLQHVINLCSDAPLDISLSSDFFSQQSSSPQLTTSMDFPFSK